MQAELSKSHQDMKDFMKDVKAELMAEMKTSDRNMKAKMAEIRAEVSKSNLEISVAWRSGC